MPTTPIQVRDARDRLIDLLGFGKTYPLRDLEISDDQLMVAFNTTAKIAVPNSQKDVIYQLFLITYATDGTSTAKAASAEVRGTGGEILLETANKIQDDISYS